MGSFLPKEILLGGDSPVFGPTPIALTLSTGLCIFVGPNGTGKSEALRLLRNNLRSSRQPPLSRQVVYFSSGRSAHLEIFRSITGQSGPAHIHREPAAVGQQTWTPHWWQFESSTGMLMRLKDRPDLLLKIEARLQALHKRRLKLEWVQNGLQVGFLPTTGGAGYYANAEASGIIELIPLLAAVYDDGIGALLIDEPEISLHPQLQSYLLQEMQAFAGDPTEIGKKLIVFATHSPTMLPVRYIKDIPQLVFFSDRHSAPIRINADAGELKSTKLSALVSRLSENHKLAFFARAVLLVEGPSDEIVVSGLALSLEHPLLASNTQVVPVTGKGQFSETTKLFRLMGKNVFVLADLDGLVDDNQLVNVFRDAAQPSANAYGMGSISEIDHSLRNDFSAILDDAFEALSTLALNHRYWINRGDDQDAQLKAKRRATLAALFLASEENLQIILAGRLAIIRKRYEALIDILRIAGCVILRFGTIEDYFFNQSSTTGVGKPEAAAAEIEVLSGHSPAIIRERYADVIRAIEVAAPLRKIEENELLREQLASLLGSALQVVRVGMPDEELNTRALANFSSVKSIFKLGNRSSRLNGAVFRCVEVSISSPLFARDGFPFEISEHDNITLVVDQRLPISMPPMKAE